MSGPIGYIYITEEQGFWFTEQCKIVNQYVKIGVLDNTHHDPSSYYPTANMRVYPCRDPRWVLSQITLSSYGNVDNVRVQHANPNATSNLYAMDTASAIQMVLKVLALDAMREPMGSP